MHAKMRSTLALGGLLWLPVTLVAGRATSLTDATVLTAPLADSPDPDFFKPRPAAVVKPDAKADVVYLPAGEIASLSSKVKGKLIAPVKAALAKSKSKGKGKGHKTNNAGNAKTCVPPPATFAGTKAGFAAGCKNTRYCVPAPAGSAAWAGPNGDVTRAEIESMLALILNTPPVQAVGTGDNLISDGAFGWTSYASSLMYEITGDLRFLDQLVRTADNILWLRNNPITGRVMWTGDRDLVWPTECAADPAAGYAGCEGGHALGHMVNAAVVILKTACIQKLAPTTISPDSPTPFLPGTNYLTRALAYIAAADQTMTSYYIRYFLDSNNLIIQPNSPLWTSQIDSQPAGQFMPWNRRFMILHGMSRLAVAHQLAPAKNPTFANQLSSIVAANMVDFTGALKGATAQGKHTYSWTYGKYPGAGGTSVEEVAGVHALYDYFGSFLVYQSGIWGDNTKLTNLANTLQYKVNFGNGTFAAFIDGTTKWPKPGAGPTTSTSFDYCSGKNVTSTSYPSKKDIPQTHLYGAFVYFSRWVPAWYTTLTGASQTLQFYSTPSSAGPLLWTKHARFVNKDAFWRGLFGSAKAVAYP